MTFFQELNFDRVLSIISCITGIVALFLSSTVYKKCKINENTTISELQEFLDSLYIEVENKKQEEKEKLKIKFLKN